MKTVKQIEDKSVGRDGLSPEEVRVFLEGLSEQERKQGKLIVVGWLSWTGKPRVRRVTVEVE